MLEMKNLAVFGRFQASYVMGQYENYAFELCFPGWWVQQAIRGRVLVLYYHAKCIEQANMVEHSPNSPLMAVTIGPSREKAKNKNKETHVKQHSCGDKKT